MNSLFSEVGIPGNTGLFLNRDHGISIGSDGTGRIVLPGSGVFGVIIVGFIVVGSVFVTVVFIVSVVVVIVVGG